MITPALLPKSHLLVACAVLAALAGCAKKKPTEPKPVAPYVSA